MLTIQLQAAATHIGALDRGLAVERKEGAVSTFEWWMNGPFRFGFNEQNDTAAANPEMPIKKSHTIFSAPVVFFTSPLPHRCDLSNSSNWYRSWITALISRRRESFDACKPAWVCCPLWKSWCFRLSLLHGYRDYQCWMLLIDMWFETLRLKLSSNTC